MNQFGRKVKSERGITLIELLLTLAITSIALTAIYSVFITGIKAYQKIGIEGGLRDEADYVVTMILNEMYNSETDYIVDCSSPTGANNCIQLIDNKEIGVNQAAKGVVEELESSLTKTVAFSFGSEITKTVDDGTNQSVLTINSPNIKFDGSTIVFTCTNEVIEFKNNAKVSNCKNALIEIQLVITNTKHPIGSSLYVEPLQLTSRFGF